jgi:hypothetical protein
MWRPRSLRLRYTLRALLVFITLFMLWGGYHANRAWRNRAAENILRRHGAQFSHVRSRVPRTALDHVGYAYRTIAEVVWGDRDITAVYTGSHLENEVVDAICDLPELDSIRISGTGREVAFDRSGRPSGQRMRPAVPRGALKRILTERVISSLDINGCDLASEDILAIASHRSIAVLGFNDTNLSDDHLAMLVDLACLSRLRFNQADLTGSSVGEQPGSKSLESVDCGNSPVTVEFAKYLSHCKRLTRLHVAHASIDDDFVEQLRRHEALARLSVVGTAISDSSIRAFSEMPQLAELDTRRTRVTASGVKSLKSLRPGLRVL